MKVVVLRCFFAAVIAGVLPSHPPAALASDAQRVRGGGRPDAAAAAAASDLAPAPDGEGAGAAGGRPYGGGRGAAVACGPLLCGYGDVHLCTKAMFNADRCEGNYYENVVEATARTCAKSEPTAIVLAALSACKGDIGTIKFELFKDGTSIRRYTEKEWPYTVFGDTTSPYTVGGRVLGTGSYKLTVVIKDPNRCTLHAQNYTFSVRTCPP